MVEVGKAFYEVEPEEGEDIVDTDAGFNIGSCAQGIGGREAARRRELHLGRVEDRVVLVPEAAIEDLGGNDLAELQVFQTRDLVEKETTEEMVDVEAGVMVADEFADIHQVVNVLVVKIGLVPGGDGEQG